MFDPRQFRNALGHFATGVAIVTTRDTHGGAIGITINSFASVSLEPPLVLWSLAKNAWSVAAFEAADFFAIHVLAEDQQDLSNRFARASEDKFAGVKTSAGLGGAPLLPGCPAVFQCSTEHRYDGGDHIIIVGRVQSFHTEERPPLLFHRGRYLAAPIDPEVCAA